MCMDLSALFIIYFIVFLSSCFVFLSYRHPSMKKKRHKPQERKAKLPPGSMGWPYVGETLQLYSQDPNRFFASKQKR